MSADTRMAPFKLYWEEIVVPYSDRDGLRRIRQAQEWISRWLARLEETPVVADSAAPHSRICTTNAMDGYRELLEAEAVRAHHHIGAWAMEQNLALPSTEGGALTLQEAMQYGEIFTKSGYFKDASDPAKAIVKILAGAELGVSPFVSMQSIYIIEGKPSISAQLLAGLVQKSKKYKYRIVSHTTTACNIEFFERTAQAWESLGFSEFTMTDATTAGLAQKDVWRKYPKAMLYNRALSSGVKMYCPELFMGPVYVADELDGNYVDMETGEILPTRSAVIDVPFQETRPLPEPASRAELPPVRATTPEPAPKSVRGILNTGDGPCVECNAPVGRPHGNKCPIAAELAKQTLIDVEPEDRTAEAMAQ